jgi:DNA-binding FadR family transcriptional regulator
MQRSPEMIRIARRSARAAAPAPRRQMKTAEIVALEIVRDISDRALAPGAPLPLESEMLAHYRVSRSSLREALRLLEIQGLIAIRPGPGAGTVVGRVSPEHLGRTMTLYFHHDGARYDELLDTWLATEPLLAGFAARNPDAGRRRDAMTPFLAANPEDACHTGISTGLGFHEAVADLADNRPLALVCRSLSHIVSDQVLNSTSRTVLEAYIVEEHAALANAIIAGDEDAARSLMHAHIQHLIAEFKACWPARIGDRVVWQ